MYYCILICDSMIPENIHALSHENYVPVTEPPKSLNFKVHMIICCQVCKVFFRSFKVTLRHPSQPFC